ncbi:hypothetical protein LTR47_003842 [Exophiala xenobiotica]|nr:hypothetical protein LTR47_003842 [Exophiala xenobiotica]KAK5247475.1 hypothetical protein LTS06_007373 [Exophiala xenobiotica]KAK5372119.1 hypothetical protein LTR11_006241 [Exophiala xenobiotica]KAK5425120.1 hypothetical protein LTR90_000712 [Exophiala xenobiotica]KAK5441615.1 hypothetical protein LTR18_006537 [Exophiala xenobiotica]
MCETRADLKAGTLKEPTDHCTDQPTMAQCYDYNADTNTQDLLPSQWVQCPSSSGCCVTGDECMDYNLCHFTHNSSSTAGSFSTYYVARCTDPTYTSPDCQKVCSAPGPPDAVYNYTTQEWMCCGDDSEGNVSCLSPTGDQVFQAPAPDDLAVLSSGVAAIASQTLIPGSGSGSPTSSTAIASSSSSSSSSASSSSSSSTLTTSSASPASSAPASASGSSSGAQAQNSSSSSDSLSTGAKAGIGIGVALGTLALIGLLLYFFLLKRRRRNRNRNTPAPPPKDDYYAGHPMSAAPYTDRPPQEVYEAPTTSESSMSNGHDKAHASQRYELD